MLKKIKTIILAISLTSLFAVPMLATASVSAATSTDNINSGLSCGANLDVSQIGSQSSTCSSTQAGAGDKLNSILTLVINIFSLVVGVIAVIMIIVGGLKYITSGGDSGNISGAKNTILYAIVGLVVVALAQFVVRFVLSKVSGQTTGTGLN